MTLIFAFVNSFNKSSERQYSLRAPDALDEPIVMVELDTSNGVMFPLYDPDTNLVFLCGKGDSVIRYFEVSRFNKISSSNNRKKFVAYRSHLNRHLSITLTLSNLLIHNVALV